MLSPTAAIRSVFRNYATFSGRATRSEYWWFQLFQIVLLILVVLLGVLPAAASNVAAGETPPSMSAAGIVLFVLGLGLFLPNLAVFVRRLHDIDFSGWFYFLTVIPGFGAVLGLIFALLPSNPAGARFDAAPYTGNATPTWDPSKYRS